MPNNQAYKLEKLKRNYMRLKRGIPNIMGTVAVNHVLANFKNQGLKENGSFKPWPSRNYDASRALLVKSGALRRSVHSIPKGNGATLKASKEYAQIQNDGGQIAITAKMRRFFWAMYQETKQPRYKHMALAKGSINIPKRQFMPSHQSPDLAKEIDIEIIRHLQKLL